MTEAVVSGGPEIVMAPMIVPGARVPGTRTFSQASPLGAVHTTVSNLPYASVTDIRTTQAGPFVSALNCSCGSPNPDSCARTRPTEPFLHNSYSLRHMAEAFTSPATKLSPTQAYLRMRAGPIVT